MAEEYVKVGISIPRFMKDFLNANYDLSPSKLFQAKILDIINTRKLFNEDMIRKDQLIKTLQNRLLEATSKIEELEKK